MPALSRRASLLVVFLTVLVDLLGFGMLMPLIPVYGKTLVGDYPGFLGNVILGLLLVVYSIMQFAFSPLWGRLSDHVGRRPILLLSLASSTFFYGLFGLATAWQSLTWMFVARIGGGIAGATIPTAQAYIADVTPKDQRAKGMALIGVAFGLGFTLGPLLGALALSNTAEAHVSPWPGYAAAGFSAVAFFLAVFLLRESIDRDAALESRTHFDLASLRAALSIPSIGSLLMILFIANFAFASLEATLPLALASFLGIARGGRQILLAFAFLGLVHALVQGGLVRRLAARVPEGTLARTGAALAVAGYAYMAVAADPKMGGPVALMIAACVVVSGLSFVMPSVQSLVSRRSDPAQQGGILGINASLGSLARITGVLLAMMLLTLGPPVPFWLAAALMCGTLGLVALADRTGRDWVAEVPIVEEPAAPESQGQFVHSGDV